MDSELQSNLIKKYNDNLNKFLVARTVDDMLQLFDDLVAVSKFYISSIVDIYDCDENRKLLNNAIEIKTPYLVINNINLTTITDFKNKTYKVIHIQPSKFVNSESYNSTGTSVSIQF